MIAYLFVPQRDDDISSFVTHNAGKIEIDLKNLSNCLHLAKHILYLKVSINVNKHESKFRS
jgi:pantothenate kinase-related protein Tda10